MSEIIDICPVDELPPGEHRLVKWEDLEIGIFNCAGELLAIEDRCSHDDGELLYGSVFDLRTGKPLNLPAYEPIETFPVLIEDGVIRLEVE